MVSRAVICTRALCLALLSAPLLSQSTTSAYVGQEARSVKALSSDEIDAYLAGKGMGLAKAAELNGYPGPSHVLELVEQLHLTAAQVTATQSVHARMLARAQSVGSDLVNAERNLDALFASKTINAERLRDSLERIGGLQAALREAHLAAHLEQFAILDETQKVLYFQLRGYAESASGSDHHSHEHH